MGSVPLATYAFLIFPEMPAALLLTYTVRRLLAPRNAPWQWALVGLCAGYLPWLHARFVPVVAGLALIFAWRHLRAAWRPALFAVIPAGLLLALFEAYSLVFYHYPVPNRHDHAGFSPLGGVINGFFGSLVDAQWGLLIVAPVYLLAAAALALYTRARFADGGALLLILLPYAAIISAYVVWWGEWDRRRAIGRQRCRFLPCRWRGGGNRRDAHRRGAAWLLGIVGAGAIWTAGGCASRNGFITSRTARTICSRTGSAASAIVSPPCSRRTNSTRPRPSACVCFGGSRSFSSVSRRGARWPS